MYRLRRSLFSISLYDMEKERSYVMNVDSRDGLRDE